METSKQKKSLIIISCGKTKVWTGRPYEGSTIARRAYRGNLFILSRSYALKHSDHWIIFSAKYGFMHPNFKIPKDYNSSFKNKTSTITTVELKKQIEEMELHLFEQITCLVSLPYQKEIKKAFQKEQHKLTFPLTGMRIGEALGALSKANRNKRTLDAENNTGTTQTTKNHYGRNWPT